MKCVTCYSSGHDTRPYVASLARSMEAAAAVTSKC